MNPPFTSNASTLGAYPVLKCALVAGLILGSTHPAEARYVKPTIVALCNESSTESGTSQLTVAESSSKLNLTHVDVANSLMATLAHHNLLPDRRQTTADKSLLFEFFNGRCAAVDVYPTGEIVVVVKSGRQENVFELGIQDMDRIIELVRDGFQE